MKVPNREAWLRAAYAMLRKDLLPEAPEHCAVTWGFPSRGATSRRRRTIGECWSRSGINGKVEGDHIILVSPTISEPAKIVDTLLHEMVHASLPEGTGHRKGFSRLAARVGLVKPWTATTASPELKAKIEAMLAKLGPWPGGQIVAKPREKSRQLKAVCKCGRILRMSAKVAAEGEVICGLCASEFKLEV
jgi:hypothetical protein